MNLLSCHCPIPLLVITIVENNESQLTDNGRERVFSYDAHRKAATIILTVAACNSFYPCCLHFLYGIFVIFIILCSDAV